MSDPTWDSIRQIVSNSGINPEAQRRLLLTKLEVEIYCFVEDIKEELIGDPKNLAERVFNCAEAELANHWKEV